MNLVKVSIEGIYNESSRSIFIFVFFFAKKKAPRLVLETAALSPVEAKAPMHAPRTKCHEEQGGMARPRLDGAHGSRVGAHVF
jgi:hypothetical protein